MQLLLNKIIFTTLLLACAQLFAEKAPEVIRLDKGETSPEVSPSVDVPEIGLPVHAFDHKVFLIARPSESKMWTTSIRNHDLFINDLSIDLHYVRIDYFSAGFKEMQFKNEDTQETNTLTDYFRIVSFHSPTFRPDWLEGSYALHFGVSFYRDFFQNRVEGNVNEEVEENQINSLFLSQSYSWRSDLEVGAYLSAGGKDSDSQTLWVPWVQAHLGGGWYMGLEYYNSNSKTIPLRFLQYGVDPDGLEFYNPNKTWYSMMNYGVKYAGEDWYFALSLMNHYTFSQPIIPLLGVGYEF